jgi:hypothetical protein
MWHISGGQKEKKETVYILETFHVRLAHCKYEFHNHHNKIHQIAGMGGFAFHSSLMLLSLIHVHHSNPLHSPKLKRTAPAAEAPHLKHQNHNPSSLLSTTSNQLILTSILLRSHFAFHSPTLTRTQSVDRSSTHYIQMIFPLIHY